MASKRHNIVDDFLDAGFGVREWYQWRDENGCFPDFLYEISTFYIQPPLWYAIGSILHGDKQISDLPEKLRLEIEDLGLLFMGWDGGG